MTREQIRELVTQRARLLEWVFQLPVGTLDPDIEQALSLL